MKIEALTVPILTSTEKLDLIGKWNLCTYITLYEIAIIVSTVSWCNYTLSIADQLQLLPTFADFKQVWNADVEQLNYKLIAYDNKLHTFTCCIP